tara:strand:- start:669 stop:1064 length:396 start_codon:yes stop_codon:yes gene_type:complete
MAIDRDIYRSTEWWLDDGSALYEHTEDVEGFNILFQALIEPDPHFGSMTEVEEENLYAEIEAGNLVEFMAVVTCSQLGQLLAEDTLGNCVYKSYERFHTVERDYYDDMVRQVIADAKERINSLKGFNHECK